MGTNSPAYPIVAAEVWREVNTDAWSFVAVLALAAGFRTYQGSAPEHAASLLQAIADEAPWSPPETTGASSSVQDQMLEAGARRMAARLITGAIGGLAGWTRVYGGPLVLATLPVDDNPFHDRNPDAEPKLTGEGQQFDPNDFRARRAARVKARAQEEARKRSEAAREARGKTTIRAYHERAIRLARVPVVGFDPGGAEVARGYIVTDYPGYAVIEADNTPGLHDNPTFWFYQPMHGVRIAVGAAPRTEAQS